MLETITALLFTIPPWTVRVDSGAVIPIPTLPVVAMRMRSVLLVTKMRGDDPCVPKYNCAEFWVYQ